ncbi:Cmx/CmrA family chloramphenicol efflux MFS transporter [Phytomonospora sp. NPDC050363]|uniref:Cmx/CmrA family chloramphenicol efflux MFS transporter n=1 Tax=Phytomonospora sp. NPDC050363 TaxID=3155642 RepID=UPI0033D68603
MTTSRKIPLAVYVLGFAIFAQGTSELMLSGLLPAVAADLDVSIPDAGLLTSGFALGMLVGAPVLAVATLRLPRRATMLVFLAAFALSHVGSALAPGYGSLLALRVVGAFAYAGFWAVAAVTTVRLAPEGSRGKAMAVVTGGLTIATIIGVPAGTFVGQQVGWRAAFWAVAALTALSAILVITTVPARTGAGETPRLRSELKVMANRRLWIAYVATAMSAGSVTALFTYLGAMLIGTTGLGESWVPIVLLLFGLGSLAGISLGGRFADRAAFATLTVGFAGVAILGALIYLTAASAAAVVVLIVLLGVLGFMTNPAVNVRVFTLAGDAPTLAGATNIAAFNVGITLGPWLAGLLIDGGFGLASPALITVALALVGVAVVGWSRSLRHHDPAPVMAAA